MLKKLLWKDKNKWQIGGAALGSFIGLFLLLLSLQSFIDFRMLISGKGSGGEQYLTINKPVIAYKSHFNEKELEMVKAQPFVKSMGTFTSNEYKVSASSSNFGFYTELFFESVADEFLDIKDERFKWEKGQREIPIIISRDYVALYNFGFAPSQGLPQLNPQFIQRFALDITLKGKGLKRTYQGRIVGYSDRIHTILVPQGFMDFANETFGEEKKPGPSRMIIATDNPNSEEVSNFLAENKYELSSGRLIGGKLSSLLRAVITLIAIIGLIIVFLSVFIFILNFQLLISKSSEDIRLLLQLGYKEDQITKELSGHLLRLFGWVVLATFVSLFLFRFLLRHWFGQEGFIIGISLHLYVYLAAILFIGLIVYFNLRNIKESVRQLF